MKGDVGKAFDDLKSYFPYTYRGVILEKTDHGVIYNRTFYGTLEELDAAIDLFLTHLEHSIHHSKINK
jgi:hypothetical protein